MKILIFSDIQFNNWQEFSKILSNGRNSRFQDQLDTLDEIFSYAKNADLVIHGGDLFETLKEDINKALFLTVYERFVQFSREGKIVILLVGNHDQLGRNGDNVLKPFREIDNVLVMDTPLVESLGDVDLAFAPFTKGDFRRSVSELTGQLKGEKRYLFSHQGVSGAKVGPRDEPLKTDYHYTDFFPNSWTHIFNGHYHKRQVIDMEFARNKFQIIGSPLQRDFGERGDEKGFLILDTDTDELETRILSSAPKFFKVVGEKLVIPKEFRKNKDFLWFVTPKPTETADIPNLRVDVEKDELYESRSDIRISLAVEEQLQKYIGFVNPQDLDVSKLLETGVLKWKKSL